MHVVVTGATGFVGRRLVAALRARGDTVTAFSRDPARAQSLLGEGVATVAWEPSQARGGWEASLARADGVVHLAGEPVMSRRWNADVKRLVLESRVHGTRNLVEAIERLSPRPGVFVCASGVDYYGDTAERIADEHAPAGSGFLADVCIRWEAEAIRARALGVREARLRIGLVLGESGGVLAQMIRPFRWFVGGPVGGGRQWLSWIHLEDLLSVITMVLDRAEVSGALNTVAPEPIRMQDFSRELGRVLHRPSWAPVPEFALRIVAGEAGPIIAESKRLVPARLRELGFEWKHTELAEALRSALNPDGP